MASSRPRLRETRVEAGMTQQQVADRLGTTQPQVARWETGESEPRVRIAVRLAELLGTTANAIWTSDQESGAAPRQRPTP